jgi:hypothetical protein
MQDLGKGFGAEDVDLLFEPFYTTKPRDGNGAEDQPVHRRSPWWTTLGETQYRPRRDLSLRLAGRRIAD